MDVVDVERIHEFGAVNDPVDGSAGVGTGIANSGLSLSWVPSLMRCEQAPR